MIDAYTAAGFAGSALIIGAYLGNLQGWLRTDNPFYPLANLIGSGLILLSLYTAWNFPSVVIEVFWAMISLHGLIFRARWRRSSEAGRGE